MPHVVIFVLSMLAASGWSGALRAQEPLRPGPRMLALGAETGSAAALREAAARVDLLAANGDLRLVSSREDRYRAGRRHESFRQYHLGVPVRGGGITRQRDGNGSVSIFGTIHEDIDVSVVPRLSPADAVAALRQITAAEPAAGSTPELVITPRLAGGHALAWRIAMDDYQEYGLNAHSGRVEYRAPLVRQERAVGAGAGIAGQRKKLSVRRAGGRYEAFDQLRPAEIGTLDVRFDGKRRRDLIGHLGWSAADLASDADNHWNDPAVVDAHAYAGFTYDYLLDRHGLHGVDGQDGRILSMVNLDEENAFFFLPPLGPEGRGVFGYGRWEDSGLPLTAVDVVGHEMMHAVTHFAVFARTDDSLHGTWFFPGPATFTLGSRTYSCGEPLAYTRGPFADRTFRFFCTADGRFALVGYEGGAVDEAYSDIVGTALEFSLHESGSGPLRADYLVGEDTGRSIRSMDNPRAQPLFADSPLHYPDAYQHFIRFLVGQFDDDGTYFFSHIGSVDGGQTMTSVGTLDYWGEHWNSTILSHAFYLAVEGGRNSSTGLSVEGVGGQNRGQIERIFVRAMTELMPAATHLPLTSTVIRQAAIDLAGAGSPAYRAVDQALNAVGLEPYER